MYPTRKRRSWNLILVGWALESQSPPRWPWLDLYKHQDFLSDTFLGTRWLLLGPGMALPNFVPRVDWESQPKTYQNQEVFSTLITRVPCKKCGKCRKCEMLKLLLGFCWFCFRRWVLGIGRCGRKKWYISVDILDIHFDTFCLLHIFMFFPIGWLVVRLTVLIRTRILHWYHLIRSKLRYQQLESHSGSPHV